MSRLEGRTEWTKRVGAQEVYVLSFDPVAFFGHELLLTDKPHPVSGRALAAVRLYKLEPDAFWELLAACPSILRGLVTTVADRWQKLGEVSQQHAKLVSLGTMAAGLARTNNPAAAARRATGALRVACAALPSRDCRLNQQQLAPEQQVYLAEFVRDAEARARAAPALDPLAQSDREDALADWLGAHGVADGWSLAPTLVKAGLDAGRLDGLAARMPAAALPDVVAWVEATLTTGALLGEMEQSTERVSRLVKAVKSYSFMDQAPLQEVDVHEGLESTLVMLGHKLRQRAAEVTRAYDPDLPRICAYGSELNQVWTNLLDNALDAVGAGGRIALRTAREPGRVLVEIADDGPGIPSEIQGRIFEPFFTTKEVGTGTGLGLDISRRIVAERHGGDIRFESTPGAGTRFHVRLPLTMPKG